MKKVYSLFLLVNTELQRLLDHMWRRLTGFPTLKRSVITPNLYLGGQYKIKRVSFLKKLGITGIVNMRTTDLYKEDVLLKDFRLLHLPTPDQHAPSMELLQHGVEFIESEIQDKGRVYIHCKHGEGRGPTMAIAYLISTGMTFDDAYGLVKKVRPFIRPTLSQIKRLREYEKIYLNKRPL